MHSWPRIWPITFSLKPSQSCSLCQATKKREQTEKYKLNPDGAKIQTQHHFSFLLQITKQWPPPLSQIHYTQAIWLEMWRWPLFVWTREKGERAMGGGGCQPGEKGDNHQVHSMPICHLVNGLILLECKAAATLTRSLSRQWRQNPVTGSP